MGAISAPCTAQSHVRVATYLDYCLVLYTRYVVVRRCHPADTAESKKQRETKKIPCTAWQGFLSRLLNRAFIATQAGICPVSPATALGYHRVAATIQKSRFSHVDSGCRFARRCDAPLTRLSPLFVGMICCCCGSFAVLLMV